MDGGDTEEEWNPDSLRGLNSLAPAAVCVLHRSWVVGLPGRRDAEEKLDALLGKTGQCDGAC